MNPARQELARQSAQRTRAVLGMLQEHRRELAVPNRRLTAEQTDDGIGHLSALRTALEALLRPLENDRSDDAH